MSYRIRDYKYTLLFAAGIIAIFVIFGVLTKKADSCQETGGTLVKNWKGTLPMRTDKVRILLTGSRDFPSMDVVFAKLNQVCERFDAFYPPNEYGNTMPDPSKIVVVHGACPTGADYFADQWAISNCDMSLVERHPANWQIGKQAGFVRNAEMVKLGADLCVAFQHNGSRGTQMTIDLARKAGIPVEQYNTNG